MSTHLYLRASAIAAISAVTFAATAASANPQNSRYGNIYDYESGHNCGQSCAAPAPTQVMRAPAYVPPQPVSGPPIYVDCSVMGSCAPQPTTVYTAPQTPHSNTYSQGTSYSQSTTYSSAPLNCPAGTTAQADGTCLQGSSYSHSMSTTTHTETTPYQGTMSHSDPVNCPGGTMAQPDGTCLQMSDYSVEIYQGDAQTNYGYQSSGASTDYRPIRK